MGLRNYVLKNNEKPATHFIEVFRRFGEYHMDEEPLERGIYPTFHNKDYNNIQPIAIFKIRSK